MPKQSVLVLGAGIAGVSTAYHLTKQGYDVTLVEAKERAGGRIDTRTMADGKTVIEAGANWVEAPVHPINNVSAVKVVKDDDKDASFYIGSRKVRLAEMMPLMGVVEQINEHVVNKLSKTPNIENKSLAWAFDKAFTDLRLNRSYDQHKEMIRMIFSEFYVQWSGRELSELSISRHAMRASDMPGRPVAGLEHAREYSGVVTNGYQQLVDKLISDMTAHPGKLTFKTKAEVTRVDTRNPNQAKVTVKQNGINQELHADAVVSALPMAVV